MSRLASPTVTHVGLEHAWLSWPAPPNATSAFAEYAIHAIDVATTRCRSLCGRRRRPPVCARGRAAAGPLVPVLGPAERGWPRRRRAERAESAGDDRGGGGRPAARRRAGAGRRRRRGRAAPPAEPRAGGARRAGGGGAAAAAGRARLLVVAGSCDRASLAGWTAGPLRTPALALGPGGWEALGLATASGARVGAWARVAADRPLGAALGAGRIALYRHPAALHHARRSPPAPPSSSTPTAARRPALPSRREAARRGRRRWGSTGRRPRRRALARARCSRRRSAGRWAADRRRRLGRRRLGCGAGGARAVRAAGARADAGADDARRSARDCGRLAPPRVPRRARARGGGRGGGGGGRRRRRVAAAAVRTAAWPERPLHRGFGADVDAAAEVSDADVRALLERYVTAALAAAQGRRRRPRRRRGGGGGAARRRMECTLPAAGRPRVRRRRRAAARQPPPPQAAAWRTHDSIGAAGRMAPPPAPRRRTSSSSSIFRTRPRCSALPTARTPRRRRRGPPPAGALQTMAPPADCAGWRWEELAWAPYGPFGAVTGTDNAFVGARWARRPLPMLTAVACCFAHDLSFPTAWYDFEQSDDEWAALAAAAARRPWAARRERRTFEGRCTGTKTTGGRGRSRRAW